jgi:hypothetical protein
MCGNQAIVKLYAGVSSTIPYSLTVNAEACSTLQNIHEEASPTLHDMQEPACVNVTYGGPSQLYSKMRESA